MSTLHYANGGAGHCGVDTSIAAAEAIDFNLPRLQKAVLAVIRGAGSRGATCDEIAQALGWVRWRVRPRTSELRRDGKIVDSGARRKSMAGVASIVWVAPAQEVPAHD
jgi:hypothetical protein